MCSAVSFDIKLGDSKICNERVHIPARNVLFSTLGCYVEGALTAHSFINFHILMINLHNYLFMIVVSFQYNFIGVQNVK